MTNTDIIRCARSVAAAMLATPGPIRKGRAMAFVPDDIHGEDRVTVALQACCYVEAVVYGGADLLPTDADSLSRLVMGGIATKADCLALKASELRKLFGRVRPYDRAMAIEHSCYGSTKSAVAEYIISIAMPRLARASA